jgi:hypothetical protein
MPSDIDYQGMAEILASGPMPPTKNLLLIVGRMSAQDVLGAFVFVRELDRGDWRSLRCSGSQFPLSERIL